MRRRRAGRCRPRRWSRRRAARKQRDALPFSRQRVEHRGGHLVVVRLEHAAQGVAQAAEPGQVALGQLAREVAVPDAVKTWVSQLRSTSRSGGSSSRSMAVDEQQGQLDVGGRRRGVGEPVAREPPFPPSTPSDHDSASVACTVYATDALRVSLKAHLTTDAWRCVVRRRIGAGGSGRGADGGTDGGRGPHGGSARGTAAGTARASGRRQSWSRTSRSRCRARTRCRPTSSGPRATLKKNSAPGVLLLHWLGEINNDRSEYLPEAITLAGEGVVSVLPLGYFPWVPNPDGTTGDVTLVENQVAALRRALDRLAGGPGRRRVADRSGRPRLRRDVRRDPRRQSDDRVLGDGAPGARRPDGQLVRPVLAAARGRTSARPTSPSSTGSTPSTTPLASATRCSSSGPATTSSSARTSVTPTPPRARDAQVTLYEPGPRVPDAPASTASPS